MKLFLAIALLAAAASAQRAGKQTPEEPLDFSYQECSGPGNCQSKDAFLVMDSNWRWTHHVDDYVNCYTGNEWDQSWCPDVDTCTSNCALDGVASNEWEGTYGITHTNSELTIKFRTEGPYSTNIGSRVYLMDSDRSSYVMFNMLNKEVAFDVDVNELDCGLNGALYFVEMAKDGGLGEFATNECGAKFGTGYCDAQCPHDMKWINGEANIIDWTPSDNDQNSGTGHFGSCCMEMDLWEANKKAQAFTSHPCDLDGQLRCEDTDCGDNASDERYDGVCDKDGCDFASYRMGDQEYFGEGKTVDSNQKMTVITQFLTSDGTDNGDLVEIRRKYVQNGQTIENSKVNIDGVSDYDSITDQMCVDVKNAFGDYDDHTPKGGLKKLGESFKRGMVFTMSMWDDHEAYMLWLDSNYPEDGDPNQPGVARGPCPTDSGRPEDVEANQPNAHVKFSNIKVGPIDSTY